MPPRKSVDLTKIATGDEGTPMKEAREGINIEDLNLPKSIVTRLAKGVLPANTQVQGNAMLAMTKSATVFISHLAQQANDHASRSGKKTIVPQDVFMALEDIEFPDFRLRLEAELAKFVELQTDKRNTYRKKVAAEKVSGKTGSPTGEGESFVEGEEGPTDREGQPAAKKARIEEGGITREDDISDLHREGEEGEEEDPGDGDEPEEEEEEDVDEAEGEEHQEPEEQVEEEHGELEDEALDNGEDSD